MDHRRRHAGIFNARERKLLTENSIDGYHALTTHATYLTI